MSARAVSPPVLRVARADADLADSPIDPAWILEGSPRARVSEWGESEDGMVSHWTWDCTAGRFRWYHDVDESVVVVDGSVRIRLGEGEPVELGVGDAAFFPAGTWSQWEVPHYVRKQAVVRVPVPRPMRYVAKGFGRRSHRLR